MRTVQLQSYPDGGFAFQFYTDLGVSDQLIPITDPSDFPWTASMWAWHDHPTDDPVTDDVVRSARAYLSAHVGDRMAADGLGIY